MKEFFSTLAEYLSTGGRAMLCIVTEAAGSTPRGAGTMMAVLSGGETLGTVGGGTVEYACIKRAAKALDEGADALEHYTLTSAGAAALGMICGGNQSIYFHRLHGRDDALLIETAAAFYDGRTDGWLFLKLHPDGQGVCDLYANGRLLFGRFPMPDEAALPRRKPRMENGLFLLPLSRSQTVYVFGGGHVSLSLVSLLDTVGFSTVVYDDRPEFASADRFPTAQRVICAPFDELSAHLSPTDNDFAVVMTRGHEGDLLVQRQLLAYPLPYIGVIGSRRKAASQHQALLSDGFDEAALRVIHSPVGLAIGAQTPAEIAVSIAAELIRLRSEIA